MKNLYLLFGLLFLCFTKTKAQNWWDWRINQSVYSNLVIDKENNFIIASGNDGTNRSLFKYNRDGLLQWKKNYIEDQSRNFEYGDGPINNQQETISVDDSGNIYTTNATFGDADNIVKLDANGNKIWGKRMSTFYPNARIRSFNTAMSNGEVYIAGSIIKGSNLYGSDTFYLGSFRMPVYSYMSVFFAKLDRNGNPLWVKLYTYRQGFIIFFPNFTSFIKVNNHVYATGDFCTASIDFDNFSISSGDGQHSGFLVQLSDINGTARWAKSIGPVSPTLLRNTGGATRYCYVFEGSNNNIILGGDDSYVTREYTAYPPLEINHPSTYLRTYDSSGNELLVKHFNNFYTQQFSKKGNDYYISAMGSLAKIDSAGNYIYQVSTPGSSTTAISPVDETVGATIYPGSNFCKVLFNSNKVSGWVFRDVNNNGIKDAAEKGIGDVLIGEAPNKYIAISNSDGYYECYVDSGSHTIAPLSDIRYNYYEPAAGYGTNFPGFGNITTDNNFAYTAVPGINDLEIVTTPVSTARPGFTSLYSVYVKNNGTENATGTAGIKLPIQSSFVADTNFTAPLNTSADSLTFAFTDLLPGEEKYFNFKCRLSASVRIGDLLTFYAAVMPADIDTVPSDNYDTLILTVRGSYDPNDKMVFPGSDLNIADKNKPLSYTIRFQNTGTDTAFNVHLVDTLPPELDIATLELVSNSHAYSVKIEKDHVLHFYFDAINLPDSFQNEVLSHGYIRFNIKPVVSVTAGSTILNNADIYFDYNKAVITNTTSTKYLSGTLAVVLKSFSAFKNNGMIDLSFSTETEINLLRFEIEKSNDGKLFKKMNSTDAKGFGANYSYTDKHPAGIINYYRIKLVFADGSFLYSHTEAVQMTTVKNSIVFPNPANDRLYFTATYNGGQSYRIYDAEGKLHFTGYSKVLQAGDITGINTSNLSPGMYYIEISNKAGTQTAKFFISSNR